MTYEVVEHYGFWNEATVASHFESAEEAREFIQLAYTAEERKEFNVHWMEVEPCS